LGALTPHISKINVKNILMWSTLLHNTTIKILIKINQQ
jgi:hypothetical protein